MLFHTTIFGPIKSRRLGVSLGVNLLPNNGKICSFDCVYCECGLNKDGMQDKVIPIRSEVKDQLERFLITYISQCKEPIDSITFAGNGEPTMHPEFEGVIDDTIALRNKYYPRAKISVLTNAWQLDRKPVFDALHKVDNAVLKLDSAIQETVIKINQPVNSNKPLSKKIDLIASFGTKAIIQTMFVKSANFDNTQEQELEAWLNALKRISPSQVQLYSLDRKTPIGGLMPVEHDQLLEISKQVEALGFETLVT